MIQKISVGTSLELYKFTELDPLILNDNKLLVFYIINNELHCVWDINFKVINLFHLDFKFNSIKSHLNKKDSVNENIEYQFSSQSGDLFIDHFVRDSVYNYCDSKDTRKRIIIAEVFHAIFLYGLYENNHSFKNFIEFLEKSSNNFIKLIYLQSRLKALNSYYFISKSFSEKRSLVKEYLNLTNEYIEYLQNPEYIKIVRENEYFIGDEEDELLLLLKTDRCLLDVNSLETLSKVSGNLKNELTEHNNKITDLLISRMNFKKALDFNRMYKNRLADVIYFITHSFVHILVISLIILGYFLNHLQSFKFFFSTYLLIGCFSIIVLPIFHFLFSRLNIFQPTRISKAHNNYSIFLPNFIVSICIGWFLILPYSNDVFSILESVNKNTFIYFFSIIILIKYSASIKNKIYIRIIIIMIIFNSWII
jgi:hypothetical protein